MFKPRIGGGVGQAQLGGMIGEAGLGSNVDRTDRVKAS